MMNSSSDGLVFAAGLFVGMLVLLEAGRRVGIRRMARDPEGARHGLGVVEGAVFSLLGLLIAFTFAGAATRFDARRQLVIEGVLGADVVGFQTRDGARNFLTLAQRLTTAKKLHGSNLQFEGRRVQVGAFPISIDVERYEGTARHPAVINHAGQLRTTMGLGRKIILGVDRLDYTKGIDVRVKAFGELLAGNRSLIRKAALVQVAVPSRERIQEYQELRSHVEELVGQINGEYGEVGIAPVHYLRRNLPFEELVALYRAADVMLVTPYCDGMNLVAKEYVATRFDNTGVLVLSEFAGAAPELRSALLVNPHDVDSLAETMDRALTMSDQEAGRRMRKLRQVIKANTVHDWAGAFMRVLRP